MFPSLFSAEQNLRSEEVHITEQLQDVEEEKDDSNEEENKDSLVDDEDEKEDLGYEEEAEEEEEDAGRDGPPPWGPCFLLFLLCWRPHPPRAGLRGRLQRAGLRQPPGQGQGHLACTGLRIWTQGSRDVARA